MDKQLNIGNNYGTVNVYGEDLPPKEVNIRLFPIDENKIDRFITTDNSGIMSPFTFDQSLFDFIKENNKVILLGGAGFGKTTELQYTFNETLKKSALKPFFINLKGYKDEEISSFWPEMNNYPAAEVILFIDGLDEPNNMSNAINNILFFANNRGRDITIVISCRTNVQPKKLQNFTSCYLELLSSQQIKEFTEKRLGYHTTNFINTIWQKNLNDLIKIPFYLNKVIEYYQDNQRTIPNDKAALFEYLVGKSIESRLEPNTNLKSDEKLQLKLKCRELLEKLALMMQSLNMTAIPSDQVIEILENGENMDLLQKSSSLLNVADDNWSFKHLNFQEYLAASIMAKMPFQKIKKLVGIKGLGYKRANPRLMNTLSFLIGLLEDKPDIKQEFTIWLRKYDTRFLLDFEAERLSEEFRGQVFIQILDYHKENNIELDYRYEIGNLIKFAKADDAFTYLLDDLQSDNKIVQSSAVNILGWAIREDIPYKFQELLKSLLWTMIVEQDEDTDIIENLLSIYNRLFGLKEEELDQIFGLYFKKASVHFKQTLLSFASTYEQQDKFIGEMLSYIQLELEDSDTIYDNSFAKTFFQGVNNKDSIIQFFDFYSQNIKLNNNIDWKEVITIVFERAIIIAPNDEPLFLILENIFSQIAWFEFDRKIKPLVNYLEKTGQLFKMFQAVYNNSDELGDMVIRQLVVLTDENCIEFFANEFKQEVITESEVEYYQRYLYSFDQNLLNQFNQLINQNRDAKIPLPNYITKEQREQEANEILSNTKKLVFDKAVYIEAIEQIFGEHEKLTKKMLFEIEKSTPNWFLIDTLYHMFSNDVLEKSSVLKRVNTHWHCCFAIKEIKRFLDRNHDKEINLEPDEIQFIKTWCDKKIEIADFTTACTETGTKTNVRGTESLLAYFITRYEFTDYKDSFYLNMLLFQGFDRNHHHNIIEFVQEKTKVSKEKITARVLQNIKNGISVSLILKNHLDYCVQNGLKEIVYDLLPYFQNKELWSIGDVLDAYIKLDGDLEAIESILGDIREDYRLSFIHRLVKYNSPNIEHIVLEYFHNSEGILKEKYAKLLLQLKNTEVLTFLIDELETINMNFIDGHNMNYQWNNKADLPKLLELFELSIHSERHKEGSNIPDFAINCIYSIVNENPKSFKEIQKEVLNYSENPAIDKFWEDIKFQFHANETPNLEEVLSILQEDYNDIEDDISQLSRSGNSKLAQWLMGLILVAVFVIIIIVANSFSDSKNTSNVTIKARPAGNYELPKKGEITLNFGGEVISKTIGSQDEVYFPEISNDYFDKDSKVRITFHDPENEQFKAVYEDSLYQLTAHSTIDLWVELQGLDTIYGVVKDSKTGVLMEGVRVSVLDLEVFTDKNGWFKLGIPTAQQRKFHTIRATKDGFQPFEQQNIPAQTDKEIQILMKQ